jgi:hypothetical protein
MAARTMVQAEAHSPSIITFWPEERSLSYLSTYLPIWPPRSPVIRISALLASKLASNSTAELKSSQNLIVMPQIEKVVMRVAIVSGVRLHHRRCMFAQIEEKSCHMATKG